MSIQIKYAYRRHNTWTYRRTYPQHLRDILGSSLKQSLKTSDAKIARKRVEELNTKFTDIVQQVETHAAENDTLVRAGRLVLLHLDITGLGSWGSAQLLNWLPGI